ncbi:MAG TPA: septum formation initiator [Sphingobacteriaceae bacterium]|nr:septum formation initiator [Sphingobacteriaceae bacterium]
MSRFLSILSNKYFLVTVAFIVWMMFFDRNDLMQQYEYRTELNSLRADKEFYSKEVAQIKTDLNELTTNREKLEKFAREKYLMKKDNEDVYIIITESSKEKKKSLF